MMDYSEHILMSGGKLIPELAGLIASLDEEGKKRFATHAIALACDTRIPANAIGYVSQLLSPMAADAVRADAIAQLRRYVPIQ